MQALDVPKRIEIREDAKLLADNSKGSVFEDNSIDRMIQRASDDLYYTLVDSGVDYFIKEMDDVLIPDPNLNRLYFRLPDDFYKMSFLLYKTSSDNYQFVPPGNAKGNEGYKTRADLPDLETAYGLVPSQRKWIILGKETGDELHVLPEQSLDRSSFHRYSVNYIPEAPQIQNLRVPVGWANYLTYCGAVELSSADYNDMDELKNKRDMWYEKIIKWANERTPDGTNKIKRVQTDDLTIDIQNNQILNNYIGYDYY